MSIDKNRLAISSAFFSAVLFGMSTPFGKLLLSRIGPLSLAGLLYLGSFGGIAAVLLLRMVRKTDANGEASLGRRDALPLAGAILCGGVCAPILLFVGLSKTHASVASLLLNTEGILTILSAVLIFRESAGSRVWTSATLMLLASFIMVYSPADTASLSGPLLILGACLMWGIDNNITRKLSHKSPYEIALLKGLAAGAVTLAIARSAGEALPSFPFLLLALLLGALSYGASLILFIYALRHVGTSRTATLFQTAPFVGAVVSLALLGEPLTLRLALSGLVMAAATVILLGERHSHQHEHGEMWHNHRHDHDEHHCHDHEGDEAGRHAHLHYHPPLVHSHVHFPDLHHRHSHRQHGT